MRERVVVLDFGGQYNQLIARRVREAGVYSELIPHDAPIERIKGDSLSAIIMTGGPDSAFAMQEFTWSRSPSSSGRMKTASFSAGSKLCGNVLLS